MASNANQVAKEAATDSKYVSRVRTRYEKEVVPYLMKHFNYKNVNQVPKLVKITINGGLGDIKDNGDPEMCHVEETDGILGYSGSRYLRAQEIRKRQG